MNEDQFWKQQEEPKPIVFFPEINQEMDILTSKNREKSNRSMPRKTVSQTGGETLPPMPTKLDIYSSYAY